MFGAATLGERMIEEPISKRTEHLSQLRKLLLTASQILPGMSYGALNSRIAALRFGAFLGSDQKRGATKRWKGS